MSNELARTVTRNSLERELDMILINYMKIYDEYYETGSRDSAFLKDLVDSLMGISACLEVYTSYKHISPYYALEKLKNSRSYIDSAINFYENEKDKLERDNNE